MEEKKRILKMVEEGKLTSEEAIKLLEAIESEVVVVKEDDDFFYLEKNKELGKMIYIRVKSSNGDKVKVNIPVEFVKMIGSAVQNANLDKYDVDIAEVIKAVENGFVGRIVEVDSGDGDKVIIEIA